MDKFASILDRPATEIERPKPLPIGTYHSLVKGMPRYDKSSKKQTDFIEFTLELTKALDDVDPEDLKAACVNKAGEFRPLATFPLKATYYLTEGAAWRLKKFLEDLGFDTESKESTMREMCEQSANSEVYVTLKHRASDDGKSIFHEIADTARVE